MVCRFSIRERHRCTHANTLSYVWIQGEEGLLVLCGRSRICHEKEAPVRHARLEKDSTRNLSYIAQHSALSTHLHQSPVYRHHSSVIPISLSHSLTCRCKRLETLFCPHCSDYDQCQICTMSNECGWYVFSQFAGNAVVRSM